MTLAIELLTVVLPLLYALLAAGYALIFVRVEPAISRALSPTLSATLGLHALYIAFRIVVFRHFPLATVFESLTVMAFALTLVYWIVERVVRTQSTGVFVLGLAFVFQTISAAFIGHGGRISPVLRSPLFGVHTTTAVIGYAALALSAVYGVLYLMLHHELKASRFGLVYERLPSLDVLAAMHERAVIVGLVSLTLTILIGVVWLPHAFGWVLADPKVLLTLAIWAVYVFVVAAHRFGWGSRARIITISIFGFALLVFSTLAVNLWLRSFHAFT